MQKNWKFEKEITFDTWRKLARKVQEVRLAKLNLENPKLSVVNKSESAPILTIPRTSFRTLYVSQNFENIRIAANKSEASEELKSDHLYCRSQNEPNGAASLSR